MRLPDPPSSLTIIALVLLSVIPHGVAGQGGGGGQRGAGSGAGGPAPMLMPPAPAPAAEGTSAISGVVIDGGTKAPVAGALVYLSIEGRGTVAQSRQLTDTKGRFA